MNIIRMILLMICGAWGITVSAQSLEKRITEFFARNPQEKIYLQTDRHYYLAGDSVWFRAHLADAATHLPSTSRDYPKGRSKFVYVELHDNAADTLIERAMIKQDSMGVFANMMVLPANLNTGIYTLVGYTRHMMNYPQELFAYKEIVVGALKRGYVGLASMPAGAEEKQTKKNKREAQHAHDADNITIAALPEGGNLIAGHRQRLAYKIVNGQDYGVDADVRLIQTSNDSVVAEGSSLHKGMGTLYFVPIATEHYRLEAYAKDGRACHVEVPDALTRGITMTVVQRKNMLYVTPIMEGIDASELSLALFGGGNLLTMERLNGKTIAIDTRTLQPGVVNIAIVNDRIKEMYAERLVFIYPERKDDIKIVIE